MDIPKTFILMGKTWSVTFKDDLLLESDVLGTCSYRKNLITLQPATESTPLTSEHVEQTFFHELMHAILYEAGEDCFDPPLHQREFLVDRISSLLHQFVKTSSGVL